MTTVRDIVVVLVPMILSLTVHEFAHAWSAFRLGDDTAASQGRLTLNPLPHIDLFGTILIPVLAVVSGGFGLIGWAKPVPISPHRFRRDISMRQGMIITAVAGPASNILLAFLVAGVSMFVFSDLLTELARSPGVGSRTFAFLLLGHERFVGENAALLAAAGFGGAKPIAALLLSRLFLMNIGLAIFNMLPVPPLDGSRLLPPAWQQKLARYTMVVFVGFIVLINWAGNVLFVPARAIGDVLLGCWSLIF
jgi:Zn-dependent protease